MNKSSKPKINSISKMIEAAIKANYYMTPEGQLLHIDFVNAEYGYFGSYGEENGEIVYVTDFSDLVDPKFYGLVRIKI
jgi:hypothetical protein